MERFIFCFMLFFGVISNLSSAEFMCIGNNIQEFPETVMHQVKTGSELYNFKKVQESIEEAHRFAIFIPKNAPENNWKEAISIAFVKETNKSLDEICNQFVKDWKVQFGDRNTTDKIEIPQYHKETTRIVDFDLTVDTNDSEKFWSISKIFKSKKGYHRVTYLKAGEIRTPEREKIWNDLVSEFMIIQNCYYDQEDFGEQLREFLKS